MANEINAERIQHMIQTALAAQAEVYRFICSLVRSKSVRAYL